MPSGTMTSALVPFLSELTRGVYARIVPRPNESESTQVSSFAP
jgi:hypothetical protein